MGAAVEGLTQWEITIAELLSGVEYATAHFGKWHLGSTQGRLPNDQGFDEWYGIPRTTDEAFWPSDPAAKASSSTSWRAARERRAASWPCTTWTNAG
jgi:arylsulfatase A-like enzyme